MNEFSKGFVALFDAPVTRDRVVEFVAIWNDKFDRVEQVPPRDPNSISTLLVEKTEDLMWEDNLQFRVLDHGEFAWIYITLGKQAIESTGMPSEQISLCLECLLALPDLTEVIDHVNERRLDQLEAEGVI
ncbi:MAG: hypothetical protein AAGK14_11090 [Verrucomicrobiota bacterium]